MLFFVVLNYEKYHHSKIMEKEQVYKDLKEYFANDKQVIVNEGKVKCFSCFK